MAKTKKKVVSGTKKKIDSNQDILLGSLGIDRNVIISRIVQLSDEKKLYWTYASDGRYYAEYKAVKLTLWRVYQTAGETDYGMTICLDGPSCMRGSYQIQGSLQIMLLYEKVSWTASGGPEFQAILMGD